MLLLGQYRQKFYPQPLSKFLERRLERMERSPIENNPRPTLRGTSTCFRGSPGGSKVPTTYPPPTLCLMHRHLFALPWADARVTGDAERKAVTFRWSESLDYIHPLKVWLGALAYRPPQGGARGRKAEGFPQGFVEWRSLLLLVCLVMLRGKPLIMSIGSFPHKAETLIIFTPHSLSRCVRV